MTHHLDNLSRLINKYSMRFGEQDPMVLDLKKDLIELQLKEKQPFVPRSILFQSNVDQIDLVEAV